MITEAQLAHWRKLADDTPPDWTAPLKDLGAIPSFQAVDFYFDNSFEVYPPLGYCGPLLVASSKEVAEFATASRTAVPALLDEVQAEREIRVSAEQQRDKLGYELESALALGRQAQARVAELEARAQTAEAENKRLREAVMHAYASLKFYGDKKSYDQPVRIMESPLIFQDNGVRARMWLNVYSQYNPVTYNSAALAATAEAENGRLKLAASNIVSWYDGHWHGETVYANLLTKCISDLRAALAAPAPETGEPAASFAAHVTRSGADMLDAWTKENFEKQIRAVYGVNGVAFSRPSPALATTQTDERAAVAEALLRWAADKWIDREDYFCKFCNADVTVDYEIGEDGKMFDMSKEIVICDHAPDCLHLRAKALRAQAGGEGSK